MGNIIDATIVLRRPQPTVEPGASREELEKSISAAPADLDVVRGFSAAHGLRIDRENASERSVSISGTVQQMENAFAVHFVQVGDDITSTGDPILPPELREVAVAVLGLDKRPIAKAH